MIKKNKLLTFFNELESVLCIPNLGREMHRHGWQLLKCVVSSIVDIHNQQNGDEAH